MFIFSGAQVAKLGTILNGSTEIDMGKHDYSQRPATSFHQSREPRAQETVVLSQQFVKPQPQPPVNDFSPSSSTRSGLNSRAQRDFNIVNGVATPPSQKIDRVKEELFAPVLFHAAASASPAPAARKGRQHVGRAEEREEASNEEGDDGKLPGLSGGGSGGGYQVLGRAARGVASGGIGGGVIGGNSIDSAQVQPQEKAHMFASTVNSSNAADDPIFGVGDGIICDTSMIHQGQQDIIFELSSLRQVLCKQSRLESIRYALTQLTNPIMVKTCSCTGILEGSNHSEIQLKDVIQAVLLKFMKGRSCNIGNMSLVGGSGGGGWGRGGHGNGGGSVKGNAGEDTGIAFRILLCDTIWTLTGTPPLLRVNEEDYEIAYGDEFE
jgi:hypothetical protein